MDVTERGPTFVRRKFTITEVLDQTLEEMAARHYQGNVSLCLRAAIESHRESLGGDGEFAAYQIKQQLDELEQRVRELQSDLGEISVDATGDDDTGESQSVLWGIKMSAGMLTIVQALDEASSPLRIQDIGEQTELPPQRLQVDLSKLVDQGLVIGTSDQQQRFSLAGEGSSAGDEGVVR